PRCRCQKGRRPGVNGRQSQDRRLGRLRLPPQSPPTATPAFWLSSVTPSWLVLDLHLRVCENLSRPYGARVNFPLVPGLAPWARLSRPSGAGLVGRVLVLFSHRTFTKSNSHIDS